MIKDVVVLDGQVINIGPWDYKLLSVMVSPAEHDDEGNVTKEAVYEDRVTNPLPEGAVIEQQEIEVAPDGGLIVKGSAQLTSDELLGQQLAEMKIQTMQQTQLLASMGAELAATKLELINLKGANQS
ncbi:hypothetical protein G7L40_00810 [Paenibacillus polymyxa]|uniref:Phage-like element PBSX protein xkdW n=1 Tax=Paenibacillus polymyxa TaxID=1406 RepID=A0A378XVW7_PAEPO|nr:hypothetical protein [Paenibacillus polymyxa]MBE7897251.1 hypothetical protein [Paenibacillus polymyxa]MBG9763101.1 phage-like element PBSX protein xkdW [Paenibacillus polymyxa]MBG9766445.1 phage-like element PBSX protein xkdW [Paenibacillus polymyxa]MCC3257499.1 hypothetical protein [Paenibacillus polymyxa]QPK51407.1 hypothetical protein G7035_00805 [Paenibacillus polymyxa]